MKQKNKPKTGRTRTRKDEGIPYIPYRYLKDRDYPLEELSHAWYVTMRTILSFIKSTHVDVHYDEDGSPVLKRDAVAKVHQAIYHGYKRKLQREAEEARRLAELEAAKRRRLREEADRADEEMVREILAKR